MRLVALLTLFPLLALAAAIATPSLRTAGSGTVATIKASAPRKARLRRQGATSRPRQVLVAHLELDPDGLSDGEIDDGDIDDDFLAELAPAQVAPRPAGEEVRRAHPPERDLRLPARLFRPPRAALPS